MSRTRVVGEGDGLGEAAGEGDAVVDGGEAGIAGLGLVKAAGEPPQAMNGKASAIRRTRSNARLYRVPARDSHFVRLRTE